MLWGFFCYCLFMFKKSQHTLIDSFSFAFRGIFKAVKKERNVKIHLFMAGLAILMGLGLKISNLEWLVLVIIISLVISAEIFNTCVEAGCNLVRDRLNLNYYETYWIRNFSAGGVLILAIGAFIIGLMIFLPKMFR